MSWSNGMSCMEKGVQGRSNSWLTSSRFYKAITLSLVTFFESGRLWKLFPASKTWLSQAYNRAALNGMQNALTPFPEIEMAKEFMLGCYIYFHFCLERADGVKDGGISLLSIFLGHSANNCHHIFSIVIMLCLRGTWKCLWVCGIWEGAILSLLDSL
jgi:hypothetical protein